MKEELIKAIDESLKEGWGMRKKMREATTGFLSFTPATYDERTVHSLKDLLRLNREGFELNEDFGEKALNILLSLYPEQTP